MRAVKYVGRICLLASKSKCATDEAGSMLVGAFLLKDEVMFEVFGMEILLNNTKKFSTVGN